MAGLEVNLSRIIIKFYNPHTNYACITSKTATSHCPEMSILPGVQATGRSGWAGFMREGRGDSVDVNETFYMMF